MGEQAVGAKERRFFRIRDRVYLACRSAYQSPTRPAIGPLKELPDRLSALGNESRTVFRKLAKESPEAAAAITLLDKKISALAAAVIAASLGDDGPQLQEVSLSASGVGFGSSEPIPQETLVVVTMLLPPSMFKIVAQGTVVACRDNDEIPQAGPYWIGVNFNNIDDRDQEVLSGYVLKRQAEQIKRQREVSATFVR